MSPEARAEGGGDPLAWLLMGHRAGDNSQVQALGESLGWPFEIKRFVYSSYELLVNLPFGGTLAGVVKSRSSVLEPPWPDMVISAGRRNEPIARWIRKQAGPGLRMIHVGRPWAPLELWDLVVTTPQYRLPHLPNVLHNETPLHRVTRTRLAEAAAEWSPRFAELPRPYIGVLAGGSSGPYLFDAAAGARLAREASAMANQMKGSLLVTTSARTLPPTIDAIFANIDAPAFRYHWTPAATRNPYFGLLGLADALIVTGDSVSMMTEACATGRPVYLFDTGDGVTSMRGADVREERSRPIWERIDRNHLRAFVYRQTMKAGPQRLTRDIRLIHELLIASGRAAWLGDGEPNAAAPPLRDVERAAARVRALFERKADTAAAPRTSARAAC